MVVGLTDLRLQAGFTKSEMAFWFGVSRQSMWQWLAGERSPAPERQPLLDKKAEALKSAIATDPLLKSLTSVKHYHRVDLIKKVMSHVDAALFRESIATGHGEYRVFLDVYRR